MHPRERPSRFGRREFLRRSATTAAAIPSLAAILDACAKPGTKVASHSNGPGSGSYWPSGSPYPLARENAPVTWKLWRDPIDSKLPVEENATLQIYNWEDYIWPKVVQEFCAKYHCDYQVTTYNNPDESLAKMQTGQLKFDIFFATLDNLGKLVTAHLLQPLNYDYIPHLKSDVWGVFSKPGMFYDVGPHYTVPYTLYTTGIGYLRDVIPDAQIDGMSDPYEILWDPKYNGQVAIYDDYREAISMALLKNGITDVNTANQSDLSKAQSDLIDMINAVNVRTGINISYIKLPKGEFTVTQSWSGDMVAAWFETPQQSMAAWKTLGYWFPDDRKGVVANDIITVPANSPHPVLAHKFLDWMMTQENAMLNFAWNGYQPPQNAAEPSSLTTTKGYYGEPYVFPWLERAVVRESDLQTGYYFGELTPQVDNVWHNVWTAFNSA
jgi:spermidine/putrescine transport system substrate-binding protein